MASDGGCPESVPILQELQVERAADGRRQVTPAETLARWCDEVERKHVMTHAGCGYCGFINCHAIQGAGAVRAVLTWYTGPGDGRRLLADVAKALETEP